MPVEIAIVFEPSNLCAVLRRKPNVISQTAHQTPSGAVALGAVVAASLLYVFPASAEGPDQFHTQVLKDVAAEVAAPPGPAAPLGSKMARGRSNLGADLDDPEDPKSLSGANVSWVASAGCLHPQLKIVVAEVAAAYGTVTVNSTCRSPGHNAAIGGAEHSYHLSGNAVDFRVHGNIAGAAAFLQGRVGGYKHSGGGLFHIDTGPRRAMN
jgi:Peptidase M15